MKNITDNRILPLLTILLLCANIITLTMLWIQKDDHRIRDSLGHNDPHGPVFEFVTQELDLDSSQREAYRALRDDYQVGQRKVQDSIHKNKEFFFELLRQTDISDSTITVYAKYISRDEEELDKLTFLHFKKLRALLNNHQQAKFDSIIQEVLHRMRPPGYPPGPPPGPNETGHSGISFPPRDEKRQP